MSGEQQYTLAGRWQGVADNGLLVEDMVILAWACQGCGALIIDQGQHDHFHQKTRSDVGVAPRRGWSGW
jgi:hypothetical protein